MIINKIRNTITENSLITAGDSILVGLSGGADSVCLTHALYSLKDELNITLYTAHLNHCIRGEEAERDEEFAKSFSNALGIKCFSEKLDIPKFAAENNLSEETAGRQARYNFFADLCRKFSIDKIATAHNKNDNAETLLMNFMRGSSLKGLCGIPAKRDNIIRPVLHLTRAEIERYCTENGLSYVTDSTNSETVYTRNKIRRELIPLIEDKFNPNFVSTITDNAVLTADDSAYIEKQARKIYGEIVHDFEVDIQAIMQLNISIRRRVIMQMISDAMGSSEDVRSVYVRDVLELPYKNSGASVNLPCGICARNEYGKIIICQSRDSVEPFEYTVVNGSAIIPEISVKAEISETNKRVNDGALYLSASSDDVIVIRSRREGDIFQPFGMTGSKKVKEYFINGKIPREKRMSIPIVEINGKIAAVGSRVDRSFVFKDNGIKIVFSPFQEVVN